MPYYLLKIHIPLSPFLHVQYLTLTKRSKGDYVLLQLNLLFFYFFLGQLAWHGQSISICSLFQEDIINYYSGKLNEIKHGREEVPFQFIYFLNSLMSAEQTCFIEQVSEQYHDLLHFQFKLSLH